MKTKTDNQKKTFIKPQTLKGFRDFLPEQMRVRQYVVGKFKETFEGFGFEPLETPTLEYASILLGKYGEEADRLVYTFKDKGQREVGLRYDLTLPTARVLAMYKDKLGLPFKRYQIQNLFRAEKPQRGRLREFTQCDIDTFGVKTPLADAEIIAVIYQALTKVGLSDFVIKINSRQVLFEALEKVGITGKSQLAALQSIDKLAKIGKEGVLKELAAKDIGQADGLKLLTEIEKSQPDGFLKEVLALVNEFGVPSKNFAFEPSMVRGLDYYTGPIYETYVTKPAIGSITGGGRYDNLVKDLGGPDVPATGTTIGLDRVCEVVEELGILKNKVALAPAQVLVVAFADSLDYCLQNLAALQSARIRAQLYPDPKEPLRGQLAYASKKKIPYVLIAGAKEKGKNVMLLKNMATGEQRETTASELPDLIA